MGLGVILAPRPLLGAEQITFSYSALRFSISVADLEQFAQTGQMPGTLRPFLQRLSEDQRADLQRLLSTRLEIKGVALSQLLYSSFGESTLAFLGERLQTEQRTNGATALRSAMIQAAQQPEGLSPISLLQSFPNRTVYLNSKALQSTLTLLRQRATLARQLAASAHSRGGGQSSGQAASLEMLSVAGPQGTEAIQIEVQDTARNRRIPVVLTMPASATAAPLWIISPGFGDDRSAFQSLTQHLVSHGIAVAIVEHPGSDRAWFEKLISGQEQEVMDLQEWSHRPRDIQVFLDWLQGPSIPAPVARIDPQQIGVLGYSIGGNTALTLAGARVDPNLGQRGCAQPVTQRRMVDFALLLLCSGSRAPASSDDPWEEPPFDPRIRAVVALNTFGTQRFAPEGLASIQIPTLMITGSQDLVAPSLPESLCPFQFMTHPHQFLVMIEQGQHFFGNDFGEQGLFLVQPPLKQPDPALMSHYLNALVLAFIQSTLPNPHRSAPPLTPENLASLSQKPYPLRLVTPPALRALGDPLTQACASSLGNGHD